MYFNSCEMRVSLYINKVYLFALPQTHVSFHSSRSTEEKDSNTSVSFETDKYVLLQHSTVCHYRHEGCPILTKQTRSRLLQRERRTNQTLPQDVCCPLCELVFTVARTPRGCTWGSASQREEDKSLLDLTWRWRHNNITNTEPSFLTWC